MKYLILTLLLISSTTYASSLADPRFGKVAFDDSDISLHRAMDKAEAFCAPKKVFVNHGDYEINKDGSKGMGYFTFFCKDIPAHSWIPMITNRS